MEEFIAQKIEFEEELEFAKSYDTYDSRKETLAKIQKDIDICNLAIKKLKKRDEFFESVEID